MPLESKNFIFDYDGTLVDSESAFAVYDGNCLNTILSDAGIDHEIDFDEARALAGNGGPKKLEIIAERYDFDPAPHAEKFIAMRNKGRPTLMRDLGVNPNPGVLDFIKAYKDNVAMASNKNLEKLENDLRQLGLYQLFNGHIFGAEGRFPKKPEPDLLLFAAQKAGFEPSETAYFGDLPIDMQAAKAAGMTAIGVVAAYKYKVDAEKELLAAGADIVVNDLSSLI